MENIELRNIWKSYDQKLDSILAINKDIAVNLTKQKLNNQISKLYQPKWTAIIIGVPYTLLLIAITTITVSTKAYFMAVGFGAIALIMTLVLVHYLFQLYLISKIKRDEEVLTTQYHLSKLSVSSFRSLTLSVFQLPFWSLCWVSKTALLENPMVYGTLNLLIFLSLSYLAYWIFKQLSANNKKSKIRDFFFSGNEWEPIFKSAEILEQLKEYKN